MRKGATNILADPILGRIVKGAAIVAAAFIAYLIVREVFKSFRRQAGRQAPVNVDELSQEPGYYKDLARRIFNAFKDDWGDFGTFGAKADALKALNAENDDGFKAVYNAYNKLISGSRTLRNDIVSEWFNPTETIDTEVLERMDELGLI
jgi:hypothetical protein